MLGDVSEKTVGLGRAEGMQVLGKRGGMSQATCLAQTEKWGHGYPLSDNIWTQEDPFLSQSPRNFPQVRSVPTCALPSQGVAAPFPAKQAGREADLGVSRARQLLPRWEWIRHTCAPLLRKARGEG